MAAKAARGQSSKKSKQKPSTAGVSYRDAGVDLETYAESMGRLPALMQRTFDKRVLSRAGGFAGLFSLNDAGSETMRDPVLVSGTDGVGTKLHVARMANKHDTVGIDLVAMCVNDVLCCGAQPLFFLDYVAMSHDDPDLLEQIVTGITEGCLQAESALLGGETAIMPGTYQSGDYDLAGFQVGVVDRKRIVDGRRVKPGDALIGLDSSGLHSNGFSLVRKVVFEIAGLKPEQRIDELEKPVSEILLEPTRIYVKAVKHLLQNSRLRSAIRAIAHITGGGIAENLARVLPEGVEADIDGQTWTIPKVFPWLRGLGKISPAEMYRVFNMGLGMVLVVSPGKAKQICNELNDLGYPSQMIGEVLEGQGKERVRIRNRRTR